MGRLTIDDYTALSLSDVAAALDAIALEVPAVFGALDQQQLNWRPTAQRWSVAQCFDHLLNTNREMFHSIDSAMDASRPRTVWQRLPVLPRLFGRLLIQSQRPDAKRRFTAPGTAQPASSAIDPWIIDRFVTQQAEAAARIRSLDAPAAARVIMVSPFASFISYSVLDGCRLIVTHEHRHLEQARRVTRETGFPSTV
jgi:hypothetical protein